MNQNLPIFDVPENLKNYATSKKDVKNLTEKMPPDSYRKYDEDIYEPVSANPQKNPQSMSNLNTSKDSTQSTDTEDDLSKHTAHRPTFAKHGDVNVSLADF